MLTQIYEVSTPEEARSISQIGVDHIGVLVGNSEFPRELPVEAAAKLAADIVTPNWKKNLPVIPDMKITGAKTATTARVAAVAAGRISIAPS